MSDEQAKEQAVGVAAIAEMLNVCRDTVYMKAHTGDIPGFRVGKAWRFYPSEVRAHLTKPVDSWAMPAASRRARRAA